MTNEEWRARGRKTIARVAADVEKTHEHIQGDLMMPPAEMQKLGAVERAFRLVKQRLTELADAIHPAGAATIPPHAKEQRQADNPAVKDGGS